MSREQFSKKGEKSVVDKTLDKTFDRTFVNSSRASAMSDSLVGSTSSQQGNGQSKPLSQNKTQDKTPDSGQGKSKGLQENHAEYRAYKQAFRDKKEQMPMCGGFVVICKGHVLLVKTPKGAWGYPKGKRKPEIHEQLVPCAYRELKEETGLKETHIHPIDIENIHFDEITDKGVASVRLFLAQADEMIAPLPEDPEELAEAKWVKIEDAYHLLTIKNRLQILEDAVKALELNK